MSEAVAETIERQRRLIAQIRRVTGLDLSGLSRAAGVAPSTFTRIRAEGSTNVLREGTLDKLEHVARQHGAYTIDRDMMTLRDSSGEEISVDGDDAPEPIRRGRKSTVFERMGEATTHRYVPSAPGVLPLTHRLIDQPIEAGAPTHMDVDEIVDDTSPKALDRPSWLAGDAGAYAVRIDGGSLEPVLLYRDYAYVTTRPGMRVGDVVIVGRNDGYATAAGIYRGRGPGGLEIGLLSGDSETIPAGKIAYVHRVVGIQRA